MNDDEFLGLVYEMNNSDERDYAEEEFNRQLLKEDEETEFNNDFNEVMEQEDGIERKGQIVWRTMTETVSSGYFVWEVRQVIDDVSPHATKWHTQAADGTYLYTSCNHFFDQASAEEFLRNQDDFLTEELIIIDRTVPKDGGLTKQEQMELIDELSKRNEIYKELQKMNARLEYLETRNN